MDTSSLIKLRKELHTLSQRVNPDKKIDIPLIIALDHGNTIVDEMNSCIMWDDENECFYSIELNNDVNDKLAQICPVRVRTFPYSAVMSLTARIDLITLMDFFDSKIDDGLTTEETKEKYRRYLMERNDPRTYAMGMPSPSTQKGEKEWGNGEGQIPILNPESFDSM